MKIRKATPEDKSALLELYLEVAKNEKGIARSVAEINESYIEDMLTLNTKQGVGIVGYEDHLIVAEMHAGKYGLQIFDHILTHLTIVVHPSFQGRGYGKQIFKAFLEEVEKNRKDIWRVELESRSSNEKSIGLYESLGFQKEGVMLNKTRNLDGTFEDSWMFSWFNKFYGKE